MYQQAAAGGHFDYRPRLRGERDENHPGVQKILHGSTGGVLRLPSSPGTAVFGGQHAPAPGHPGQRAAAADQPGAGLPGAPRHEAGRAHPEAVLRPHRLTTRPAPRASRPASRHPRRTARCARSSRGSIAQRDSKSPWVGSLPTLRCVPLSSSPRLSGTECRFLRRIACWRALSGWRPGAGFQERVRRLSALSSRRGPVSRGTPQPAQPGIP